jgi:hypothetical protein
MESGVLVIQQPSLRRSIAISVCTSLRRLFAKIRVSE